VNSAPDATPTTEATGEKSAEGRPRTEVVEPDESALLSLDFDLAIVTGTLDNGLQYSIRENDNPTGVHRPLR
jgi:hypothetical protein